MNKSAIALAVAAALATSAAAQAETILYGSARVSVDYQKADVLRFTELGDVLDIFDEGVWDVVNNSSRLGVRGSEDLGNGLSAIYQYEFGVDATEGGNFESNRPKLVGLRGENFGTISVGTQWTPYYNVVGVNDVFNSSRHFTAARVGRTQLGVARLQNSVFYQTPDFNGFNAQGMIVMDGPNEERGVDIWNAALMYANGPIFAGATYISREGDLTGDQYAISLGWTGAALTAAFTFEDGDFLRDEDVFLIEDPFSFLIVDTISGEVITVPSLSEITVPVLFDAKNYLGTLSYAFGSNIVRVSYGYLDPEGDVEATHNYALGFQHNLSTRSRLWVEYLGRNQKVFDDATDLSFSGDSDVISVGMRHDF